MSELHRISGCDNDARKADVLFVHGLGGDASATWRHGEDDSTSWPHWVGTEFPDLGVWSLGYAADPTKRLRLLRRLFGGSRDTGYSMALPRRAAEVLELMSQRGFGKRPTLFVCHSLGGLLAKQILRLAAQSTEPEKRSVFESTRGVLFLATPHAGAQLASLVDAFQSTFGATVSIEDLREHDAHLEELFNWYRNSAGDGRIRTVTYYETRKVGGLSIVNSTSAHPGVGRDPIPLDENHVSIAKPRSNDSLVCGALGKLLKDHVLEGAESERPVPAEIASSRRIRVLVVDDHPIVRTGIRAALEKISGVEVVGEAGDGREALDLSVTMHPDIVLMDITMAGLNGIEATNRITKALPATKVIVMSRHEDEHYYWGSLRAGACGYLLKKAATSELETALTRVVAGEIYLSRDISSRLLKRFSTGEPKHDSPLETLTQRQREILQLIAEGQTTKAIGATLNISPKTVEYHRNELMKRLNIYDVPGLVRFALREGLIHQES